MGRNALDSAHIVERAVLTASRAAFSFELIPGCARWANLSSPAPAAGALDHTGQNAVVNGDPRSLTNTKGEDGLSRWDGAAPAVRRPASVRARGAVLEPGSCGTHAGEVDLV